MPDEGQELTEKRSGPCYLNVKIQEVDKHYLANFHHGPARVFHTMDQLLKAIEEEVNKISSGS